MVNSYGSSFYWPVVFPIAEFMSLHPWTLLILIGNINAKEPWSAKIYSIYKDNIETKEAPVSL